MCDRLFLPFMSKCRILYQFLLFYIPYLSQKTIWRVFCCMINVPLCYAVQYLIK